MSAAQINGEESIVENSDKTFEWSVRVPIFRNSLILKQLGLAVGIPFGLLILFFTAAGIVTQRIDWLWATGMVLGFLFIGFLFVLFIFRGTYDVHFVLDSKGILCENTEKQAKRVKSLSLIMVVLGLISRNPTAAGAGMLAGARVKTFLKWGSIRKVKYNEKRHTILLRAGFSESIAVFCTADNYGDIKTLIQNSAVRTGSG